MDITEAVEVPTISTPAEFTDDGDNIANDDTEPLSADYSFVSNLSKIYNNEIEEVMKSDDKLNNLIKYQRPDGSIIFIKKSSFLWMCLKKKSRVSPDRMRRFLSEKSSGNNSDVNYVWIGQFAFFLLNKQKIVAGQVLGFKYLSGKRTNYSLDFCPIKAPSNSSHSGIGVLVSFYEIKKNDDLFELKYLINENLSYINIDCLIKIVEVHDTPCGKLVLSDASALEILPFF